MALSELEELELEQLTREQSTRSPSQEQPSFSPGPSGSLFSEPVSSQAQEQIDIAEFAQNLGGTLKDMSEQLAIGTINGTLAGIPGEIVKYAGQRMTGVDGETILDNLESDSALGRGARGVGTVLGILNPVGLTAKAAVIGTRAAVKGATLGTKLVIKAMPKVLQSRMLARILAREIFPTAGSRALKTGIKLAGASAGVAAILPPSEEAVKGGLEGIIEEKSGAIPAAAATGAVLGVGGSGTLSLGKSLGRFIRQVGGVSRASIKEATRLGIDRVIDPAKREAGYIGNSLVPRALASKEKLFSEFTPRSEKAMRQLGISERSIRIAKDSGMQKLNEVQAKLGGSSADLAINTEFQLGARMEQAKTLYKDSIRSIPEIVPRQFLSSLRGEFTKQGLMVNGQFTPAAISGKNVSTQTKSMMGVYNEIVTGTVQKGGAAVPKTVSGADMRRYHDVLDNKISLQGNKASDIPILSVLEAHTKDVIRANPLIENANKVFSRAKQMSDKWVPKLKDGRGEALFARAAKGKISKTQNKALQELDDYLPVKFKGDLKKLGAHEEINIAVAKEFSPNQIEKSLSSFSQFEGAGAVEQNRVRSLYKLLDDGENIVDDALSRFVGDDLLQEKLGAGFAGGAGLSRKAFEAATRLHIRRGIPAGKFIKESVDEAEIIYGLKKGTSRIRAALNRKISGSVR